MSFGAILTAILAAIPAIEKIMGMVTKMFPPKTEQERGVDKYKKSIDQYKAQNQSMRKAKKAAKLGRTKAIEKILNG